MVMGKADRRPSNTDDDDEGSKGEVERTRVKDRYLRLAMWRAERQESGTVEGRKRKEGEMRGRKKNIVGV
jgi:hypothetical protein